MKGNRWHRNIGRRSVPVVCGLPAVGVGRAKGQGQNGCLTRGETLYKIVRTLLYIVIQCDYVFKFDHIMFRLTLKTSINFRRVRLLLYYYCILTYPVMYIITPNSCQIVNSCELCNLIKASMEIIAFLLHLPLI